MPAWQHASRHPMLWCTMTAPQFRAALKRLKHSRGQLAKRLRVNVRTVYRWASGASVVPDTVSLLLECWLREQRRRR